MKRFTFILATFIALASLALASYELGRNHGTTDGFNAGYLDGRDSVVCPKE